VALRNPTEKAIMKSIAVLLAFVQAAVRQDVREGGRA
jgi:hypothetical protein